MRRLNAIFTRNNAQMKPWVERASQLSRIHGLCLAALPAALAPHIRTGGITRRRLTLLADNGATAGRLKLLAPRILKHLQDHGEDIHALHIEVHATARVRTPVPPPRALSKTARTCLAQAAQTLGASPLREALERLAKKP